MHWQVDRTKSFTEQLIYEINSNIYDQLFFWDWLKEIKPKKFINISSIKIFSELNENPISSLSFPKPLSPYGIAKVTAENYFNSFFHKSITRLINLRLGSVCSYGEVPTQLLTQLFNSAFNKKKITINKGHITHILFIEEAIDLIISSALLEDTTDYLIVGEGKLNEFICQRFEELSNCKLNAEYIDLNPGVIDPVFISDLNKLQTSWARSYQLDSIINLIIKANLSLH